jgi:hypothetical protein
MCAGTSISFNQFQQVFAASGKNTTITLTDAYAQPPSSLLPLVSSAGQKNLVLDASAAAYSAPQLISLIQAATGGNTELDVGSINSYPLSSIASVLESIGNRNCPIDVDCQFVNEGNALPLMEALRRTNGFLTMGSANALPDQVLNTVLSSLSGKSIAFIIDAKLSSPERVLSTIGRIEGNGFSISLINPQYIPLPMLHTVFAIAAAKNLAVILDVEYFPAHVLKTLSVAAGAQTSIIITTAQTMTTADLIELLSIAGGRRLSFNFNGRQLSVDPVGGDKLQRVVSAAAAAHTIVVNTAQYPPLSYLLPVIQSSGHTNMVVSYNGSQITDTQPHGNVVVRGIGAAQASTSIVVTSVGVTNFILSQYLDILRAADSK